MQIKNDNTLIHGDCVNTDRDFIGMELTEEYFEIAKKRIDDAIRDKHSRLDL